MTSDYLGREGDQEPDTAFPVGEEETKEPMRDAKNERERESDHEEERNMITNV